MVYNTKYQQRGYIIIMCIKINVNILCHFLWNDLTNNILLKMCYIFYKASMQLISQYWLSKLVLLYEPGTVHELFMDLHVSPTDRPI